MHDSRIVNESNGKKAVYPILLWLCGTAIVGIGTLAGAWALDVRAVQTRHDDRITVLERSEARNDAQHEAIRGQLDRIEALLRERSGK